MARTCPRCDPPHPLRAVDTSEGPTTDFCSGCGGIFFDPGELQEFVGVDRSLDPRVIGERVGPGPVCPGCGEGMSEIRWPRDSELHIDVCSSGGAWLDRGELGRLRRSFRIADQADHWGQVVDDEGETLAVPMRIKALAEKGDRSWFFGSVVVVFLAQVVALGGLRVFEGLALAGDRAVWTDPMQLAVASVVGFFVGGALAGRMSAGFTIWEPAAAAVPACVVFALVFHAPFSALGLVGMLGAGVCLTLAGAVLGERLQA